MLKNGDTKEVFGSGKKPYVLKNIDGVCSCSCPAWRNQSAKIDVRTCKHLKAENGEALEAQRIGATNPATIAVTIPESPKMLVGSIEMDKSKRRNQHGGFIPFTDVEKSTIVDIEESRLGRKLRQDEKTDLFGPPLLLAHTVEEDFDPTGWLESEKLDGVRAYWNGEMLISRGGNVYQAPEWFVAGLPKIPLDGELWMGRGKFQATTAIVRRMVGGDEWVHIMYMVFDAPNIEGGFENRLRFLETLSLPEYAMVHEHTVCDGKAGLRSRLKAVSEDAGEGLMLRKPDSLYEAKRSHTLLKMKTFHDAEAVVIGYEPGKKANKGKTGALVVQIPNGKTFSVGTGLSAKDRETPPPIGATITYSYTELTNDGKPKCAAFVGVREE
jgi:DNA ligase-1